MSYLLRRLNLTQSSLKARQRKKNNYKKKALIFLKRLGVGLGHIPICRFSFTPPINTPTPTPPVSAEHTKFSFPVLNMEKQKLGPAGAGRCTESEPELQGELESSGSVG